MNNKYTVRAARARTNRTLLWLNAIQHTRDAVTIYGWKRDNWSGSHGRMSSL